MGVVSNLFRLNIRAKPAKTRAAGMVWAGSGVRELEGGEEVEVPLETPAEKS